MTVLNININKDTENDQRLINKVQELVKDSDSVRSTLTTNEAEKAHKYLLQEILQKHY